MARRIVVVPIWLVFTLICSLLGMILPLIGGKKKRLFYILERLYARGTCLLAGTKIDYKVLSPDIDPDTSYVVVANHQSLLDAVVLVSILPMRITWIGKRELFYIPFFGWAMWMAGFIPTSRSGSQEEARKSLTGIAGKLRRMQCSIIFFAEGTRSEDGTIRAFKVGAFRTAVSENLPILPVAISGAHTLLPKRKLLPHPGTVTVTVGSPVIPVGNTRKLAWDVRQTIIELMNDGTLNTAVK